MKHDITLSKYASPSPLRGSGPLASPYERIEAGLVVKTTDTKLAHRLLGQFAGRGIQVYKQAFYGHRLGRVYVLWLLKK